MNLRPRWRSTTIPKLLLAFERIFGTTREFAIDLTIVRKNPEAAMRLLDKSYEVSSGTLELAISHGYAELAKKILLEHHCAVEVCAMRAAIHNRMYDVVRYMRPRDDFPMHELIEWTLEEKLFEFTDALMRCHKYAPTTRALHLAIVNGRTDFAHEFLRKKLDLYPSLQRHKLLCWR